MQVAIARNKRPKNDLSSIFFILVIKPAGNAGSLYSNIIFLPVVFHIPAIKISSFLRFLLKLVKPDIVSLRGVYEFAGFTE